MSSVIIAEIICLVVPLAFWRHLFILKGQQKLRLHCLRPKPVSYVHKRAFSLALFAVMKLPIRKCNL